MHNKKLIADIVKLAAPQIKRLRGALGVDLATPAGQLTEAQWGIVIQTMLHYVPRHRWPKGSR